MNTISKSLLFLLLGILGSGSLFAQADTGLVHLKTITGTIRPKSVVHNSEGIFFAQNMMYRHSITVYDRHFNLQKTISDEVNLKQFGIDGFQGKHQGSPVEAVFSPDGKYAWVSNYQMYGKGFDNPGSDNCQKSSAYDKSYVFKIDTDQLRIKGVLQAGCVPKHLACSPDGRLLLVSNWCSGDLSIFDAQADSLLTTLELGNYPRGIAIDSRSRYAYVTVMGAYKIARVDLKNFTIRYIEKVGRTPRHICLSPDDQFLYVSLNAEGKVLKYDLATLQLVEAKRVGTTPRSMVLSPGGDFLYLVNYKDNQMTKVKTADMSIVQQVKTNSKPIGITLDEQEKTIWVACYTGSIMVYKDYNMDEEKSIFASGVPLQRPYFPFFALQQPPTFQVERIGEFDNSEVLVEPTEKTSAAFCIILGSFQQENNAEKAKSTFAKKGIDTRILAHQQGKRLAHGAFADRATAQAAMAKLNLQGWILKLE